MRVIHRIKTLLAATLVSGVGLAGIATAAYAVLPAHNIGTFSAGSVTISSLTYQFDAPVPGRSTLGTTWSGTLSAKSGVTGQIWGRVDGTGYTSLWTANGGTSKYGSYVVWYGDVLHPSTSQAKVCHVNYYPAWIDLCTQTPNFARG